MEFLKHNISHHNKNKLIQNYKGWLTKKTPIILRYIVVSPWGNAEWCWRDYEAIYSNTVLIKPDTSFVKYEQFTSMSKNARQKIAKNLVGAIKRVLYEY